MGGSEGGAGLTVLRCAACGRLDPGPRDLCCACFGDVLQPLAVDGAGVLVSWTKVRRPSSHFAQDGQYTVCVADLDCGVRVTGRLDEGDAVGGAEPAVAVGMKLVVSGEVRGIPLFSLDPRGEGASG